MTTSPNKPTTTWQDPDLKASDRLDALIAEMSLPEKLAQLGSVWLGFDVLTGEVAPMQNVFSRNTFLTEGKPYVSQISAPGGNDRR